jgi:PIN domain nuclease of toxin-antitoxin system
MDAEPWKIAREVTTALASGERLYFSAASAWEVAIKRASGKMGLAVPFTAIARQLQLSELEVTAAHGELAGSLPRHHGDPFDRLLVAQAMTEELVLVTADAWLTKYEVELLLV